MRYRFPYHMFMKWFVPYSPSGAIAMSLLLVPFLTGLLNGLIVSKVSTNTYLLLNSVAIIFQVWFGQKTMTYHRSTNPSVRFIVSVAASGLMALASYALWVWLK